MNILILENVSELEYEMSRYLNLEHSKDKKDIVFNLSQIKQPELHKKLLWADCICVQSLFNNRVQLQQFVLMLKSYPNITSIRIIHGYTNGDNPNRLLQLLNEGVDDFREEVVNLINTRNVSEIVCRVVEIPNKEKVIKYFKQRELQYDIVPLYVNYDIYKLTGLIWHERQPCPDKQSLKFYKTIKKFSGLTIQIEQKDIPTFCEMMHELEAAIEYQKESCELQDFGNSKKLIAEKEAWLDLINKYKLNTLSK